jgi:hypothetical protein
MIETLLVLMVIGLGFFLFGVPLAMYQSEKWFEKERKAIYKDIFQVSDRITKLEDDLKGEEK